MSLTPGTGAPQVAPAKPWMPTFFGFPITTTFGAPTAGNPGVPHLGVDFATPIGTPIEAAGAGTVTKIFADQLGGNQIQVKYANGGTGWFAHLNAITAHIGDAVSPQTVIGYSGNSGTAYGAHLHYQLLDTSGASVNPLDPATFSRLVNAAVSVLPGAATSGGSTSPSAAASSTGVGPSKNIPLVTGLVNIGTNTGVLWRIGFVLLGIAAVWVGGRMYFKESPEASWKKATSG
jgi:hypothetical protein